METTGEILNDKIKNLDSYLDGVVDGIKNKISKKNQKIMFLKKIGIKNTIKILKLRTKNIHSSYKIIGLQQELSNVQQEKIIVDKIDFKLEDIEAMKMIIEQLEDKEKKIITASNNIKKLNEKIVQLTRIIYDRNQQIINIQNKKITIAKDYKDSLATIDELNAKLKNTTDRCNKAERDKFELEGIKRIQYDTINNLKSQIEKQNSKVKVLKDNFKLLVNEFNEIIKRINQ